MDRTADGPVCSCTCSEGRGRYCGKMQGNMPASLALYLPKPAPSGHHTSRSLSLPGCLQGLEEMKSWEGGISQCRALGGD